MMKHDWKRVPKHDIEIDFSNELGKVYVKLYKCIHCSYFYAKTYNSHVKIIDIYQNGLPKVFSSGCSDADVRINPNSDCDLFVVKSIDES